MPPIRENAPRHLSIGNDGSTAQVMHYPRKGDLLPASATRQFNAAPENVISGARASGETTVSDWFEGSSYTVLDEEVIGLGSYGFTLTVFSSEELPEDPYETEDEETDLIESYQPKFARGR